MATPLQTVRILGSGTSTGVPVIGCDCAICLDTNPKNKRLRSSVLMTDALGRNVVIDTTPDFRQQMLSAEVTNLSAVLYTHTHADHCHGFDDIRAFSFQDLASIDCYSSAEHLGDLRARFSYAFEKTHYYGVKPMVNLHNITDKPFQVLDWEVEPLYLEHGGIQTIAFRIGSFAYATDFKAFTAENIQKWKGKVSVMVASGIRYRDHPAHSTLPETIELFAKLGVRQGYITHISHEIEHVKDSARLPKGVSLAYDGMMIDVR